MFSQDTVLFIAGPTGVGKSKVALELALYLKDKGFAAEIVCADSITIYRGFDIGAAKPSIEEQNLVPHHLLDISNPEDRFTAGSFLREADAVIQKLQARKVIPIITGGSGFYFRALLSGMVTIDEDPVRALKIRARWEKKIEEIGWAAAYEELLKQDPEIKRTVHANDHYRILRSLQALELYGSSWSKLNQEKRKREFSRFPKFYYFCCRREREELRKVIQVRTQKMLTAGLKAEVEGLLAKGVSPECKAMTSVGYKQVLEVLQGKLAEEKLEEMIVQETAKLAKRQMTWFRGEKQIWWLDEPFLQNILKALEIE